MIYASLIVLSNNIGKRGREVLCKRVRWASSKGTQKKKLLSKQIFIANQLLSLVRNDRPHMSTANKIFSVYAPVVEQIYCFLLFTPCWHHWPWAEPTSFLPALSGKSLGFRTSEGLSCQIASAFDDAVGIEFHINFSMLQYAISRQGAIIIYSKLQLTITWYHWHKLQ